jgi:hypothetical protein
MDLVNPEEREQLRNRIIEKIRSDITALFTSETERLLKEKSTNTSSEDLAERQVLVEPDLT